MLNIYFNFLVRTFNVFSLSYLVLFVVLFSNFSLYALPQNSIEVRIGGFVPSNKLIRHLYKNVGTNYSIEASHLFKTSVAAWINGDYFSKRGKFQGCSGHTHLHIPNLSFGLKYFYPLSHNINLYTGLGASLGGVFIKNRSDCLHDNISRFAIGATIKSGIHYQFDETFFTNLFFDYLYQPVRFRKHVDVGGIKTGIGFGYGF